jgi:hypothetical protein
LILDGVHDYVRMERWSLVCEYGRWTLDTLLAFYFA